MELICKLKYSFWLHVLFFVHYLPFCFIHKKFLLSKISVSDLSSFLFFFFFFFLITELFFGVWMIICFLLLLFSHSVVSDSLGLHGLQHTRIPCPSLSPGACSNSCPSTWWYHATISSSVVPFSSCLKSFPVSVFSNESALHIKWPEYWSFIFSISPSNEYSGLISFRIDWFDLLAVHGTLKSLLQPRSSKESALQYSAFFMVQLSHPYVTTGKAIAN